MDGKFSGIVVALSVLLLPMGIASPPPNPLIPAPDEFSVEHNATINTMTLTWETPDGVDETQAGYVVYINGDATSYALDPLTVLAVPHAPTLVSVATIINGEQGAMSLPLLFGLEDAELLRLALQLQWEGEGNLLPEPCPVIILGINPNPPYVFQIDWDCIPEPVRTILWELLH